MSEERLGLAPLSMTSRTRDTWLLIAGLPGVVAPFVPFISWVFGITLSLMDVMSMGNEYALLVLPGFLPLFVVAWQLRRVVTGRDGDAWRKVAWFLAVVAMAASVLAILGMGPNSAAGLLNPATVAILFGPIVANIGLLLYGRRRGLSPEAVAENFLLCTYVATALPHVLSLIADAVDEIGPWLVVWTCFVYASTIAVRLRATRRSRSSTV